MSIEFIGQDNQFGVATRDNVGTAEGQSTFDNPPQGSKDLVVTTKDGDTDPRLFELGDTYDVSWGGQVGGSTIIDAVVVRSDPVGADGTAGVIVFEGVDENGEVAQVIWTPGFDLEGWYADNYNPSAEPQFYTTDSNAAYDHRFVCFASETRIRTPDGSKAAGAFKRGDLVSTKDAGDVAVLWVGHRICAAVGPNAPVVFAQGAMGNTTPIRLSQQHRVLLKSPYVQYYFGVDEAFVPAKSCVNGDDILIIPQPRVCYVHLLLEKHHVVSAEGLECESLFLGDEARKLLYAMPELQEIKSATSGPAGDNRTARRVLKMEEARLVLHHERLDRTLGSTQFTGQNFGLQSQML
ncbi:Hint domain-containing protein [Sulfitobacter sp. HNIBRBA2951]|uniref:Hint domain-containing protein n=1 Tax=Sulfitobacter aquimarinus TaxID=3158557 RepID=UPI0032DF791A